MAALSSWAGWLITTLVSLLYVFVVFMQRRQIVELEREVAELVHMLGVERAIVERWQKLATEGRKESDAAAAALVDLLAWAVGRPDPIPIDELLAKGQQLLDAAGWAGDYPAGHKAPETAPQQKAGQ